MTTGDTPMALTAEEALYLLEAVGAMCTEEWAPCVGPRMADISIEQHDALVSRLVAATGIDPADLRIVPRQR